LARAARDGAGAYLKAVVVSLLAVVGASAEAVAAVVHRRVAHESVLERLVALLVPLEVPDHLLFLDEHARVAVQTVEVLPSSIQIPFSFKFNESCQWAHAPNPFIHGPASFQLHSVPLVAPRWL